MSYHLTLLRTAGKTRRPIAYAEFEAAVRAIPELRLDPATEAAAYFRGDELRATLSFQEGEIWTNVPEPDVIAVMIRLADALGGRVRGDEFETYRTPEDAYDHPDDAEEKRNAEESGEAMVRDTRRKQWILNVCLFGTFALLALIIVQCEKR
jgi:hypothetical protein